MAWEYHKVEVAWASQPDATFPLWTDETARVDPNVDIMITRGRSTEVDTIEPSTLSLAFTNPDHRFTPGNPYSPLYPNVKPARKIRVSETIDGVTYYLFTGYIQFPDIESWAQATPGTKFDQTINITAVDRMGRLDRAPAFRSTVGAYIRASPDLVAWYPLDETVTVWRDALDTYPPIQPPYTYVGFVDTFSAGGPAVPPADDGGSAQFSPVFDTVTFGYPFAVRRFDPPVVTFPTPVTTTSGSISLTCWSARTVDSGNFAGAIAMSPGGAADSTHTLSMQVEQTLDGFNAPVFNSLATLTDGVSTYSSPNPNYVYNSSTTNRANLITMRITMPSKTFEIWLNDAIIYSAALTGSGTLNTAGFAGLQLGAEFAGTVSDVQVRNGSTWGFADHVAQWRMGVYGLARQTPGQRIATVLGYAGVSSTDMRLDGGSSVMVNPRLAGVRPSDAAREAANTDSGLLFVAGDGTVVFHARDRRYNPPVAATIDLTWLTSPWRHRIQPPVNVASITNGYGTTVTSRNTTSITEYGEYPPTGDVSLSSAIDVDADNLGGWLTTYYADPRVRAPAMTIDLTVKSNTIRHTVLGREISDRITMSGLPVNAPEGIGAQFIEGIVHRINPRRRAVTFNTSPLVGSLPGTTPTWPTVGTAVVGASTLISY